LRSEIASYSAALCASSLRHPWRKKQFAFALGDRKLLSCSLRQGCRKLLEPHHAEKM